MCWVIVGPGALAPHSWEQCYVEMCCRIFRDGFKSLLACGGASLEMIGRLLGHTLNGSIQRYAHLIDASLRAGVNAVGEMLKPRLRLAGESEEVNTQPNAA